MAPRVETLHVDIGHCLDHSTDRSVVQTSLECHMDDPLSRAEARLQRFWNVDGLHEIGIAILFGLTAVWVWAADLSGFPKVWRGAFSVTFPLLISGGIWAERAVVERIRDRLTVPRVGFVSFRRPTRRRRVLTGVAGAVVAAGIAVVVWRYGAGDWTRWFFAYLGGMIGFVLSQMAWKAKAARFYILAAVCAATGVGLSLAGTQFSAALVLFWSICGAATLVSGAVTLSRFLRRGPAEEA